jgi:agmatinase
MTLPSSVLPSIQVLLTDLVLASDLLVSDKVLEDSTFSKPASHYLTAAKTNSICSGGYNVPLATNPFNSWATVLDCGDIPVTS